MSVCLNISLCITYMPGPRGDPKWASDPLDLELPKAVSCPVGAGNQIPVFCKSSKCMEY